MFVEQIPCRLMKLYCPTNDGMYVLLDSNNWRQQNTISK